MLRAAPWVAIVALAVGSGCREAAADAPPKGPDVATVPGPLDTDTEETEPEVAPWDDAELVAIPEENGAPLDQVFPVLAAWVHPVADTRELTPVRWQRKYGAVREGGKSKHPRKGCRKRHCGLDLAGPRGRTIVAAMDGVVKHIESRRNGKDGISGRYVRIAHDGGVFTAYMHLDSIAPGLRVGDPVTAGQYIGRLGKTGIRHGDPHLHFNLELPSTTGSTKWDDTRLIDATPFLQRARVISDPAPKQRSGRRPQS